MTDTDVPASPKPASQTQLRILLVDPTDLVHWGFRSLLSREPWVERLVAAHDMTEARSLARRYQPHVAVVSLPIAGESAVDICAHIGEDSPATRVLLLGDAPVSAASAAAVGAAGIVPKTWSGREIVGAARSVGLGMAIASPELGQAPVLLSDRERVVLELIATGSTNQEIAERLSLSPHTVKDHVSGLYRKIKARNRAEAIIRAQRLGLLA